MSNVMRGLVTLAGAIAVFSAMWITIGFMARAVKELFCWGYGC